MFLALNTLALGGRVAVEAGGGLVDLDVDGGGHVCGPRVGDGVQSAGACKAKRASPTKAASGARWIDTERSAGRVMLAKRIDKLVQLAGHDTTSGVCVCVCVCV